MAMDPQGALCTSDGGWLLLHSSSASASVSGSSSLSRSLGMASSSSSKPSLSRCGIISACTGEGVLGTAPRHAPDLDRISELSHVLRRGMSEMGTAGAGAGSTSWRARVSACILCTTSRHTCAGSWSSNRKLWLRHRRFASEVRRGGNVVSRSLPLRDCITVSKVKNARMHARLVEGVGLGRALIADVGAVQLVGQVGRARRLGRGHVCANVVIIASVISENTT